MFNKPNAGWVTVEIEGFKGHVSSIQPFVLDTFSAIIEHLENGKSQCVNYNEEGSDFTIVFTNQKQIYLITSREYLNITALNITPFEFAKEILKDFEAYKTNWENFICAEYKCTDESFEIFTFNELLEYLKYIINKEEEK